MTSAVFPILTFNSANRCTTERVWSGQFWALSRRKISSRFTPRRKLSKGSLARHSWFSSTDFNDLTDTWTWTIHGRKCCSLSRFVAPDNEDKCEIIRCLFRFRRLDFRLAWKPAVFWSAVFSERLSERWQNPDPKLGYKVNIVRYSRDSKMHIPILKNNCFCYVRHYHHVIDWMGIRSMVL